MTKRDEFAEDVKRVVALRAGHLCSNPDCRHPTVVPHSDPAKANVTGQAAHIRAAAINGPRHDPSQTTEERKDIANAIWLCGNCNKKVDTDWAAWPPGRLLDMKAAHEQWILAEAMIPKLPAISLTTRTCLRLHDNLPELTPAIQAAIREHELVINNPNRVALFNFVLFLNLPETFAGEGHSEVPHGANIRVQPVQPANEGFVRGNAKITMGPPVPTQHFRLEIEKVAPNAKFNLGFYSVKPEQTMPYELCKMMPESMEDPEKMDEHKVCHFFLEGTFQFVLRGEFTLATMFVPLLFKAAERTVSSYPVQDSQKPYRVWRGFLAAGATLQVGGPLSQ